MDDGLGADFSGVRAHAHLEMHMRECAERYRSIEARFDRMQEQFDRRMDQLEKHNKEAFGELQRQIDRRYDALSGRQWAAMATIIVMLLGAVGTLSFFLLTQRGDI